MSGSPAASISTTDLYNSLNLKIKIHPTKLAQIKFLVSPSRRLLLLLCTYILGLIITGTASSVLIHAGGALRYPAMLRIATVVQDLFLFILPAVATAMIITRQPAALLAIDKLPPLPTTVAATVVLICSSPLMEAVIRLNDSVHLPDRFREFEAALRNMEDTAGATVEMLLNGNPTASLILGILIVGIMTGFAEEIFFRGAFQRILASCNMSHHAAIWIAAAVFSALHMQFFGFFPRMLLGAFFGYMLLWSGSLWLPVMLHALNNSLFVIFRHTTGNGSIPTDFLPPSVAMLLSAIITIGVLWWLHRQYIISNNPPLPSETK